MRVNCTSAGECGNIIVTYAHMHSANTFFDEKCETELLKLRSFENTFEDFKIELGINRSIVLDRISSLLLMIKSER